VVKLLSNQDNPDKIKGTRFISKAGELCKCPKCGETKQREEKPCSLELCPNCGTKMIRST
jgi:ribosomal protein L32